MMRAIQLLSPCVNRCTHRALLIAFSAVLAGAETAHAQGLLGQRYFEGNVGFIRWGNEEVKEIDEQALTLRASLNIPANDNVDVFFSVGHVRVDGEMHDVIDFMPIDADIEATTTDVLGGTTYHFTPDQTVDPFVGAAIGIQFGRAKFEASSPMVPGFTVEESVSENEFRYEAFAGAQFDISNQTAIAPIISIGNVEDEHVKIKVLVSHWFNESMFATVTNGIAIDEGDFFFNAGVGFGF